MHVKYTKYLIHKQCAFCNVVVVVFALYRCCARTINLTLRTNTPTLLSKIYWLSCGRRLTWPLYIRHVRHQLWASVQHLNSYGLDTIHKCRHDFYSTYKQILCHKCRNRTPNRQCLGILLVSKYRNKIAAEGGSIFCFAIGTYEYTRILLYVIFLADPANDR